MHMIKHLSLSIVAVVMFIGLMIGGLSLAQRRPLWNDELYSQTWSVEGLSYPQIIAGKVPEGNNPPLFYVWQKFFCERMHYQLPNEIAKGDWTFNDPYSNVLLRVWPVTWMSSAIVLIFYFFGRFYSLWTGIYALTVALSSFMVWSYGFEARPYALIFFLTTIQTLCFLRCFGDSPAYGRLWKALALIHCFLALTAIFSLIQISVSCMLLWCLRDRDWRKYVWLWFIPVAVIVFYYMYGPKYAFRFVDGFMALIGANIPMDRLFILGIFGLFWAFAWGYHRGLWVQPSWFKGMEGAALRLSGAYGMLTGLILAGCLAVLVLFKLHQPADGSGFQISNRYFICLAPLGIIATSLFSYYLVSASKWPLRLLILTFLGALLLWRIFRTAALVGSLRIF